VPLREGGGGDGHGGGVGKVGAFVLAAAVGVVVVGVFAVQARLLPISLAM
jgi:hypothetical protein